MSLEQRAMAPGGVTAGSGRLIIRVDHLYDGAGRSLGPDAWVAIEGGIVRELGTGPHASAASVYAECIDIKGASLLPGLVDPHSHLTCTGGPAAIIEAASQIEPTLESRAVANGKECLASGVTTVRDAGGKGLTTLRARDRLRTQGSLDVLASGMPITTRGGHLHFFGLEANSAGEVQRAVQRLADAGADFVKVMASPGIQTPGNDPYSSQYSADVLSVLVRTAHENAMHVAAHAHSVSAIQNCVSAGVDTIEHFSWLGGNANDTLLKEVASEVASRSIEVDPTTIGLDASVGADGGLTEAQRRTVQVIIDRRRRVLMTLAEAGVEILPGTDAGSTGVRFRDMVRGLRLLQDLLGWTGSEAIRAATSAAASAVGRGTEIGTVAPGMKADLVVVEGDPAEDLKALSRVLIVLKDGAIRVDNRRLVTH